MLATGSDSDDPHAPGPFRPRDGATTLSPVVVTGRDVRTFPARLVDQVCAMLESYGVPGDSIARERDVPFRILLGFVIDDERASRSPRALRAGELSSARRPGRTEPGQRGTAWPQHDVAHAGCTGERAGDVRVIGGHRVLV